MTAQASLFPAPSPVRTFVGCGQCSGWKFTLTPSANAAGSPGFDRVTLTARTAAMDDLRGHCEYYERLRPGYTEEMRQRVEHPEPDWVEAEWLAQWLKSGSVREERRT